MIIRYYLGKANIYYLSFDMPGRAESMKMLFKEANIEYEFVGVDGKWPEMKKEFDFGQVPAVKMDGKLLVQSSAIMVYLGTKYGFYPQDPQGAYEVMWWFGGIGDMLMPIYKYYSEKDPAKQKDMATEIVANHFARFLAIFENKLGKKENKEFLVGQKLSIADFKIIGSFRFLKFVQDFKPLEDELLKYPTFKSYLDKYMKYYYE